MASMNLGSLFVTLNADSKGLASGMARASEIVEKFAKETKKLANDVAQVSGGLLAMGGAAVAMAASVDKNAAASMARLEKSTKLVAVQVFDILKPAVESLAVTFRKLADWIAGLDPEVKKNLATWAIYAAQVAVAAKAIGTIFGLLDATAGAFGAMAKAVAAVGIVPLLEVAVVIGGVIALVIFLHRAWRKNWGGIQEVVADVVSGFQDTFSGFATFMKGVWDFQVSAVEKFVMAILEAIDAVQELTGKKLIDTGYLKAGFKGLFEDLRSGQFIAEGIKFGKTVGQEIADATLEEIGIIKNEVMKKMGLGGGLSSGGVARQPNTGVTKALKSGALYDGQALQKNMINFGDAFEHEAAALDKAAAKVAKAHEAELQARLKMAGDAQRMVTLAKASATGDLTGLTDTEKKRVTSDTGGAWADLTKAQQNFGNFAERMGPTLLGALGKAGQSIANIIQGATTGGPWGAVVAAVVEVVQTMPSFGRLLEDLAFAFERVGQMIEPMLGGIFDFIEDLLAVAIEALAPLFQALTPIFASLIEPLNAILPIIGLVALLFSAIAPALEMVASLLSGLFVVLKPIIQGLFYVVKGIFIVVGGAIAGIMMALTWVWNAIIDAIAFLVEGIVNILTLGVGGKAVGDDIRKAKGQFKSFDDPMKDLVTATWDEQAASTAITAAKWDEVRASKEAGAAAQEVAEAFSNVPSGYKIAQAQYNAQAPMGGGGGENFIIGQVVIQAQSGLDPEQMANIIRMQAQKRKAALTGSGFSGGGA
jgi:phage-related protein